MIGYKPYRTRSWSKRKEAKDVGCLSCRGSDDMAISEKTLSRIRVSIIS